MNSEKRYRIYVGSDTHHDEYWVDSRLEGEAIEHAKELFQKDYPEDKIEFIDVYEEKEI